ncbi:MAG: hypothetical protein VX944_14285 [Myxococcota bacterium]|nr:hypothetical protein [Myxococcota bacterium]
MNAAILAFTTVFSHLQDGRDLHYDGELLWSASSGGLAIFDSDGRSIAVARSEGIRDATAVGWVGEALILGTANGAFELINGEWVRLGETRPVVAVTEYGVVYRDGSSFPDDGVRFPTAEAVAWRGGVVRLSPDGRMRLGDRIIDLPGPVADAEVVDGAIRIALHSSAAIWDGKTLTELTIPATAAGRVWGTSEGALVADDGTRIGGVPALITAVREVGDATVVSTNDGVWSVGHTTERWTRRTICDNFITGIARHNGELVVSTFNGGACRLVGDAWVSIELPSTMANDVLSTGETLWIATSEGLVEVGVAVHKRVGPERRSGHAGMNHNSVNALASSMHGAWAADVLGPVSLETWTRHRWSVPGRSHQAVAACDSGEVWVGSEDAGVSVRGAALGRRNGRSRWHQFGRLDGLPEDWVMAIACAGPGAAWVGTYRHGVGRVDASGWTPLLEDAWVQALLADSDGLWIGTADGLYRADDNGVQLVAEEDVHALFRDSDTLWVGTRSGLVGIRL